MSGGAATRKKASAGLEDRPCRPHRCPRQTKASIERRIVTLRQRRGLGPARIAGIVRHARLDRAPGAGAPRGQPSVRSRPHDQGADPPLRDDPARRARPRRHQEAGPDPEGWRLASARPQPGTARRPRPSSATPTSTRRSTATPASPTPKCSTTSRERPPPTSGDEPAVLRRPRHHRRPRPHRQWRRATGRMIRRRSRRARHSFTRPYRPQTNGKAERFNRTLLAEWAYVRTWTSEGQRNRDLPTGSTSTTITGTTPPSEAHR